MTEKYYKTFDLALAAALFTVGFPIKSLEKVHHGKAAFIFKRDDNLAHTVNIYWADKLQVNPRAYFDALKHIKTRIYSEV